MRCDLVVVNDFFSGAGVQVPHSRVRYELTVLLFNLFSIRVRLPSQHLPVPLKDCPVLVRQYLRQKTESQLAMLVFPLLVQVARNLS